MKEIQTWVAMGYIKGVFGIKGWVKIKADTEYVDSLLDYSKWQLRKNQHILTLELESSKIIGDELQIKFKGIDDRDAAMQLRGYTIEIAREEFAPTEENEYYWTDLIGMCVQNQNDEILGTVQNLMQTGAHDILVIDSAHGQKLIPFIEHYILSVNMSARLIIADWGLDY